jgi:MraZ protein
MFCGTYEHSIDDKGRLSIPTKLRDESPHGVYVTSIGNGCLTIYTEERFEELSKILDATVIEDSNTHDNTREIFAGASYAQIDSQGRILIPQYLRDEASLLKDVTINGYRNKIELWNPEIRKARKAAIKPILEADPNRMAKLGF